MKLVRGITPGRGSLYLVLGPVLHKALEVGYQWDDPQHFYVSWRLDFRGRDHAGLRFAFQLGRFFFEFSIYDHRHWNHDLDRWEE